MTLPMDEFIRWFSQVFWALLRIGGFMMVVPIFGNELVSPRIRITMALAVALAVSPLLTQMPMLTDLSLALFADVVLQLVAGIGLGFATMVFFQLFVVAGQFIGMQMGLGFAMMVDPGNGVQVTALSQFYLILVTLMFLAMNGHLVVLDVLIAGFKAFPLGTGVALPELAREISRLGGWMFVGGVLVALPAVVSLLVVNLTFGVMSRSAPQLNVFSLGFPFSLLFGLVIIWLSLSGWLPQFESLSREFFEFARLWMH